ncbi:sterol desaturase family protein [Hwanghaeella sp.]|uniref:sterol desaturase family protein n=1 Tax=Hwanghaeella sp. TaxID=2605943 RepID=UPI003CCBBEB2
MELNTTDMPNRQRDFRAEYRSRIAGWYNGWLHVAIIYIIGGAAFFIYVENISNVQPLEWLTVPVIFMVCNLFEWFLHRHVMHRPLRIPGLRAIYSRHTLTHHQFFTEKEMRFAGQQDWRVTFFPPYALVVFILMSMPGAYIAAQIFTENVGWLLISTTTGMYLLYEFMHFCCHVEENWFVRNMPFVNTIRRHHTAHHDQSIMMERNMNLTFPISDWLFGTSDLDRGLLGHIFNGYSTKFIRKDMRRTSKTPTGVRSGNQPAGAVTT